LGETSTLRTPGIRGALVAPALLVFAAPFLVALSAPTAVVAADACEVLTAAEVEQATGMAARQGTVMEVWTGAIGCSFGTEPFDVRTYVAESTNGPAVQGLGAGDPVDGLGDGARWVWCEVCLDSDRSSSTNTLVVAQNSTYLHIAFEPTNDEAANQAVFIQEQQRGLAIELARLALPRLAAPSASDGAAPSGPAPTADGGDDGAPSAEPIPQGQPAPAQPGEGGAGPGSEATRPFAASVPTASEVSTDPSVLLQSALLAALLVFFMPFPGQLFNSTLEAHEDEVRRWLRLDRLAGAAGRIGDIWTSWPGVAGFTLVATLLYGFLDPGFGLDVGSVATFLGMLLGITLVTAAFSVPAWLAHRRHGDRPSVKVVPMSLLVGVACVLVSRLTSFQPGYLYGLLIGLAFARELSAAEEGRATAIGAGLMLVTAIGCWLVLGALPSGESFGLVVVRTALAALMVAGLEGVVFGLLPMRFLPGESLYAWNRLAWGGLLGVGAFAFFHVLINPTSGYLADSSRTPLLTVIALLIGFSAVSILFWAWFRFRTPVAATVEPGHEP
jgi:hypothetical protein